MLEIRSMIKKIFHGLAVMLVAAVVAYLVLLHVPWFRGVFFTPERAKPVSPSGAPKYSGEVVTCSAVKAAKPDRPRSHFGFGEKIYAYATMSGVPPGAHTVSFNWFTPGGKCQEVYRRSFQTDDGAYACWSWIELEGEIFPISLGPLGSGKFVGEWTVKIYGDGFFLTEAAFSVR